MSVGGGRSYLVRVHLPVPGGTTTELLGDVGLPWAGVADLQEERFVVYAWPLEAGRTDDRAYAVNQEGQALITDNRLRRYAGPEGGPAPEAAFQEDPAAAELGSAFGGVGSDGQTWRPLGG